MECRRCASPLERPGDYCLVCETTNADAVVLEAGRERATLTVLAADEVLGRTTITTTPEPDAELRRTARRNFAGRIADEIRRKRPEAVYATGDHDLIRAVREDLHFDVYRVSAENPVDAVLRKRGDRALDVVEKPVAEKLGGSHTTLIGGRAGERIVRTVGAHPHVKKIIPGPIEAGGASSRGGVRAKVTRADDNGNVRLLVRDGSSVQEVRIVTTARERETGERIRADLNDALCEADLQ